MGTAKAFLLGLVSILCLESIAVGQPKGERENPNTASRSLKLSVVERGTKRPLAGITITSTSYRRGADEFRAATDALGRCTVPIPPRDRMGVFVIHAWKDGFVPIRIHWLEGVNELGVPASHTLILDPAAPIGGTVRDEEGRPVVGAKVFPSVNGPWNEIEDVGLPPDTFFETDAEGWWHCAIIPAAWNAGELYFRVVHPGFVSPRLVMDRRLPIRVLRAMRGVVVLQTGFTLSGTVADEHGKPIAGATVVLWESEDVQSEYDVIQSTGDRDQPGSENSTGGIRVKTSVDGRFRFGSCAPGVVMITVETPGLAPDLKQVRVGPPEARACSCSAGRGTARLRDAACRERTVHPAARIPAATWTDDPRTRRLHQWKVGRRAHASSPRSGSSASACSHGAAEPTQTVASHGTTRRSRPSRWSSATRRMAGGLSNASEPVSASGRYDPSAVPPARQGG